jgi:hypothetical protein
MRVAMRDVRVTLITLVGVIALGLVSTVVSVAAAAARTSVLIMGGSGDPLTTDQDGLPFIRDYTSKVVANFIRPSAERPETGIPGGPYNTVAVITPAQFNTGDPADHSLTFDQSVALGRENLEACVSASAQCDINTDIGSDRPEAGDQLVVFGFSQSSAIATLEKIRLAAKYPYGEGPDVSFVLAANGNRPNGGYLARGPIGWSIPLGLPGGGLTFNGSTPTNTQYSTIDIAIQYDGWADQPINPANLLAVANANAGQRLLHPHYADYSLDQPGIIDQGQYGDTRYLMIPTDTLPLLYELSQTPVVGSFLADVLDAPLRVLVESGYDRTSSPGEPKPWSLLPAKDPLKTAADFLVAIPTGWDNAIEDVNGTRPFGTQRPGPYGVGGPSVDYLNPPDKAADETPEDTSVDAAADIPGDAEEVEESSASPATLVSSRTAGRQSDPLGASSTSSADVTDLTEADTAAEPTSASNVAGPSSEAASAEPEASDAGTEKSPGNGPDSESKRPTRDAAAASKPDADAGSESEKSPRGENSTAVRRAPRAVTRASTDGAAPKHRAPDSDVAAAKQPSRTSSSAPRHARDDHDRQAKPAGAQHAAGSGTGASDNSASASDS